MGKRIVIALGGNALGSNLPEQMEAVKITAKAIVDLIEEGHEVIVAHGNGPQVGMIKNSMDKSIPMSVCVAMSQAYIGYDLQNALREEMLGRGLNKAVSTVLTQVEVDPADPAFLKPTKPIGSFMTKEEAEALEARVIPVLKTPAVATVRSLLLPVLRASLSWRPSRLWSTLAWSSSPAAAAAFPLSRPMAIT